MLVLSRDVERSMQDLLFDKDIEFNKNQFNITKYHSLSSLGRTLFDIKNKYKFFNDEHSLTLGKCSLFSGILDLNLKSQLNFLCQHNSNSSTPSINL